MMHVLLGFFFIALISFSTSQSLPRLEVLKSGDGAHHFLAQDGTKPFFWAADTAWTIFHNANDSTLNTYLTDRSSKNFNVIQSCCIAFAAMDAPNINGDWAFSPNHTGATTFQ